MIIYETTWLPADWLDESIPETLRHPSDFIHKCEDGSFIVIPKISKDNLAPEGGIEEQEHLLFKVGVGDVVRFQPMEMYGWFPFYVSDNLSFWIEGDYPSKANCFYEPCSEDIFDSLDQMIENAGEFGSSMSAGSYQVQVYWWGNDVAYRFEIAPDGIPRFVEVGAVQ